LISRKIDQIFDGPIHNAEKSFIFLYLLVWIQVTLIVAYRVVMINATEIGGGPAIQRARPLRLLVEMRAGPEHQFEEGYQRLLVGHHLINRPIAIIIQVHIKLAVLVREDFGGRDLGEGIHPLLGHFLLHLIDTVKEEVLRLGFV
jgi:hypothetical protein